MIDMLIHHIGHPNDSAFLTTLLLLLALDRTTYTSWAGGRLALF